MSKNSLILGLFAIATTGLIVLTQLSTKAPIEQAKQQALAEALYEVLPRNTHNNDLIKDTVELPASNLLGTKATKVAYIGRQDNNPVAAILQVSAPEGYGGTINLLVAILADGTISGVRVVPPHQETPGLGDKIELKKSAWVLNFNHKSLANLTEQQWKVDKDGGAFDSFTGATITPRAVVDAVYKSLQYFKANKAAILNKPGGSAVPLDLGKPIPETLPATSAQHP
ncbi:MAG: electron transport complex subunit RsxG [Gammaproteobacteria bacterium]|nr:MAG: electron transport complex subunit RsxG [Gammaproteobacteria bacterium]